MSAGIPPAPVAGLRLRQLPLLARPYLAAVRWQPAAVAALGTAALVAWKADDLADAGTGILVLRGVAALLALGAAFLLDDAAADVLASSPTSLAWRRASRLLAGALLVGLPWVGALLTATARNDGLPVLALCLEFGALLALGLGAAAGLARWADAGEPGLLAAPLLAGLLLALLRLPERWALVVGPGPAWDPAHQRWAALLAAAALVLVLCMRDPAAGRPPPGRPVAS